MCYRVQFFERNNRNHGDLWSLRQTGVFQKLSASTSKTTWILLHISKKARAVLEDKLKNTDIWKQHPLLLHITILSSLATDWTAYLQHLHALLGDLVRSDNIRWYSHSSLNHLQDEKVTFSRVPQRRKHDYEISFADCQQLHLLEQKSWRVSVILDHCLQISTHFEKHGLELGQYFSQQQTDQLITEVKNYSRQIGNYKKSIESLLKRSQGTAVLVIYPEFLMRFRHLATLNNSSHTHIFSLRSFQRFSRYEMRRYFRKSIETCRQTFPWSSTRHQTRSGKIQQ